MTGEGDHKYRRPQIIHDFQCGEKTGAVSHAGALVEMVEFIQDSLSF
jgi:hypothetical protein